MMLLFTGLFVESGVRGGVEDSMADSADAGVGVPGLLPPYLGVLTPAESVHLQ